MTRADGAPLTLAEYRAALEHFQARARLARIARNPREVARCELNVSILRPVIARAERRAAEALRIELHWTGPSEQQLLELAQRSVSA